MAEIYVSSNDWNAISPDEQQQMKAIIESFFKGDKLVPAPAGKSATSVKPLGNPFCETACNIAESAAVAACRALPNPVAIAACIAAAQAAGDLCRSRC
jgi:hypothetical protein